MLGSTLIFQNCKTLVVSDVVICSFERNLPRYDAESDLSPYLMRCVLPHIVPAKESVGRRRVAITTDDILLPSSSASRPRSLEYSSLRFPSFRAVERICEDEALVFYPQQFSVHYTRNTRICDVY